jgi:hypothetical protein
MPRNSRKSKQQVVVKTVKIANANTKLKRRKQRGSRRNNRRTGPSLPGGFPSSIQGNPQFLTSKAGSLRMRHCERWIGIAGGAGSANIFTGSFVPTASGMLVLDSVAQTFDRYVVHNVTVHYRPSVGTTKDGYIVMGVDWDSKDNDPTSTQQVESLYPNLRTAVWQDGRMPIGGQSRIMTRKFLRIPHSETQQEDTYDTTAFKLQISLVTQETPSISAGDIWCTYDVTLEGPVAPTSLKSSDTWYGQFITTAEMLFTYTGGALASLESNATGVNDRNIFYETINIDPVTKEFANVIHMDGNEFTNGGVVTSPDFISVPGRYSLNGHEYLAWFFVSDNGAAESSLPTGIPLRLDALVFYRTFSDVTFGMERIETSDKAFYAVEDLDNSGTGYQTFVANKVAGAASADLQVTHIHAVFQINPNYEKQPYLYMDFPVPTNTAAPVWIEINITPLYGVAPGSRSVPRLFKPFRSGRSAVKGRDTTNRLRVSNTFGRRATTLINESNFSIDVIGDDDL